MNAIGILLAVSAAIILLSMVAGAILLSRDRASATEMLRAQELAQELANATTNTTTRTYRLRGGFLGEVTRLDREDWYVWLQIGILMVGQGIILKPSTTGTLTHLDPTSNDLLGMTMILGSMFSLVGSALGLRWFLPKESDLRIPYALGFFGQFAVLNSVAAYAVIISLYSDLIGTLGGGLAIVVSCASLQRLYRFARDIYERTKIITRLRDEVQR